MVKFIYYLIFCYILLLYCCGEHNPSNKDNNPTNNSTTIPSSNLTVENKLINNSNSATTGSQINTNEDTILTADEEEKFNVLKAGFDTILLDNKEHTLKEHKANIKPINKAYANQIENILNKYPVFINWLENNPQKKKKLANAFTPIYNFLNDQRIKQSSTLTTKQLIINTINCIFSHQSNAQCNDNNYAYNNLNKYFKNDITIIFKLLLAEIDHQNTNEEIFEAMLQDILLKPAFEIANLIGINRLEEMIRRKKLNDSQRQGLDFLKKAFTNFINKDHKLYVFLMSNENKTKMVLDHINDELSKCNEDAAKKDTFKDAIKNYFYKVGKDYISNQKLDEFKDKVTSGC